MPELDGLPSPDFTHLSRIADEYTKSISYDPSDMAIALQVDQELSVNFQTALTLRQFSPNAPMPYDIECALAILDRDDNPAALSELVYQQLFLMRYTARGGQGLPVETNRNYQLIFPDYFPKPLFESAPVLGGNRYFRHLPLGLQNDYMLLFVIIGISLTDWIIFILFLARR